MLQIFKRVFLARTPRAFNKKIYKNRYARKPIMAHNPFEFFHLFMTPAIFITTIIGDISLMILFIRAGIHVT